MSVSKGIFVVAGYGAGYGTGSASAQAFAKAGYKVALIGRDRGDGALAKGADSIKAAGGEAAPFSVAGYGAQHIKDAFKAIHAQWPNEALRVALWNASKGTFKPFLSISTQEWEEGVEVNILGPAAFSREVIESFKKNELTPNGARGTLFFTGATASIRGGKVTSQFSSGKNALRAFSQSLAKEFGNDNIHVAHTIIDGGILTERSDPSVRDAVDKRLSPEGIAEAYIYLAGQDRSTWTWELDLRPAHEKW